MEVKANIFINKATYPFKGKSTIFLTDIKHLDFCGKSFGFEANASVYELPYAIKPTPGDHDFEKCESCQTNHAFLVQQFIEKYQGFRGPKIPFPYCCPNHTILSNQEYFNKNEFDLLDIPKLVADKIILTKQHILNRYKEPDWFEDITDYINYAVNSFGQMPKGCGEPLYLSNYILYVVELVKQLKADFPEHKKKRILEFLISATTPKDKQQTDLNILLKTYQDWYKIFPFELSCFAELKENFYPTIQKISYAGQPMVNRYSGVAVVKMHTKSTLFDALIELTNNLLTQINGATLQEKGLLTDGNKYKLELIINKRKLELKEGYTNNSTNEDTRFRKMLKQWFKHECRFIDEITPLLNISHQLPAATTETQNNLNITPEDQKGNCFNRMSLNKVVDFFKPFTTERSTKNNKPFLTEIEFQNFINRAFCNDQNQPIQTFNLQPKGEDLFIWNRFYQFYSDCKSDWYETEAKCRDKYIRLLTDNFTNWKFKEVKANFNKKPGRNWPTLLK